MISSSSFCPHRSAIPAESDWGEFLANERLLRNCVETNGASPVGWFFNGLLSFERTEVVLHSSHSVRSHRLLLVRLK